MLTALGDDSDTVAGLELGADDYIVKPVAPRVLLARVRALLRRSTTDLDAEMIDLGVLQMDVQAREAILDKMPMDLTTAEFDLLLILARRAGRVQDRGKLVEEIRGIDFHSYDRSVDVLISRIRRKMGTHGKMIRTVQNIGYCLSPVALK
jgi:DNA-binding response OmpR family regulator